MGGGGGGGVDDVVVAIEIKRRKWFRHWQHKEISIECQGNRVLGQGPSSGLGALIAVIWGK